MLCTQAFAHSLAGDLAGPLPVGPVALGWIGPATASRAATQRGAPEQGPVAHEADVGEAADQGAVAGLKVAQGLVAREIAHVVVLAECLT